MKLTIHGALPFLTSLALMAAAAPSAAQSDPHATPPARLVLSAPDARVAEARAASAAAHLARGDAAMQAWKLAAARWEYTRAHDVAHEAGLLPDAALWRLAEVAYAMQRHEAAAAYLAELADAAQRHGRPDIAAAALLEATVFYQKTGQQEPARRCMERLDALLPSPLLPDTLRQTILARVRR